MVDVHRILDWISRHDKAGHAGNDTPVSALVNNSLILMAAILLTVAPVTIRNLIVADDFVLVSSSGGINFYIGNNESANGISSSLPPPLGNSWEIADVRYIAEKESGRTDCRKKRARACHRHNSSIIFNRSYNHESVLALCRCNSSFNHF